MARSAPAGPARSDQVMPDQPCPSPATRRTTWPSASAHTPGVSARVRRRACSSHTARSVASSMPADHHPGPGPATGLRPVPSGSCFPDIRAGTRRCSSAAAASPAVRPGQIRPGPASGWAVRCPMWSAPPISVRTRCPAKAPGGSGSPSTASSCHWVVEALVVEALVVEALVVEALVVEALVVEALVVEALVVEALVVEALVVEALVV